MRLVLLALLVPALAFAEDKISLEAVGVEMMDAALDPPAVPSVVVGKDLATKLAKFEIVGPESGGLTAQAIDRVIKASAGIFRACYQKELNRTPNIGGKLVVRFTIASDGSVSKAAIVSSTVGSKVVDQCVLRNIRRLRFPAPGAVSHVNYPFLFAPG